MIENLSSTKEELEGIKQEGENIEVGYETKKGVKYWAKKGALIGALALTLTATSSYMPVNTTITAEAKAKKDTKKPTLKFKGKTTMTAEKGKNITIPKVTAKDNKDGNITKKIQVSVKKGTKNYASLAKKIKNGKNVKFSDIGKYVITYTVKDKAGNKATKKRYVNVVLPKTKTTEAPVPYVIERPSTTQIPVTTKAPVTTEAPVTTQTPPTTENPYPNAPIMPIPEEYANYDIQQVTVNGINYNVTEDEKVLDLLNSAVGEEDSNIVLSIEKDYISLYFPQTDMNDVVDNYKYLNYYGKIHAYDSKGNDISNSIIIYATTMKMDKYIYIYAQDDNGNKIIQSNYIGFPSNFDEVYESPNDVVTIVSTDPKVYGVLNENELSKSSILQESKKLAKCLD